MGAGLTQFGDRTRNCGGRKDASSGVTLASSESFRSDFRNITLLWHPAPLTDSGKIAVTGQPWHLEPAR